MILEINKTKLAPDKELAVHRLLQSITRMDYQCLNRPIQWEDNSGKHMGYYHPMDLMHFVIKNLDIPSRCKLYQKLSLCKLAVPVLFPGKNRLYMDMSLRHVKIAWTRGGQTVEGDVTNAPVMLISMVRCGELSEESASKTKLANDMLKFKSDPDIGSCGFFSRYSLSSNKAREVAKGTVEGMWYEGKSNADKFPASFGLLNLRGDALEHMETASTLASVSDVLFMFCDKDTFKSDSYKNLLQATTKKLSAKEGEKKRIQTLVVVFRKYVYDIVRMNRALFQGISKTVIWEMASNSYQKFLASINNTVQNLLRTTSMDPNNTLNARLGSEEKESSMVNTRFSKEINDSLLKVMDMIKNADEAQRSALKESLFPLQSTTQAYAETQRKENRSLDIHKKTKLAEELIAMRQGRFEKIKNGLPEIMSAFLRELLNARSVNKKLMFVRNVQYCMDDWCCKYLFDIRMQYLESVKQLTSLKEIEIKHKKTKQIDDAIKNELRNSIATETVRCTSLSRCLLDMSVGIENIFREIGEIYETTKRNDMCLIKELDKCVRELPELAASLLMKGLSIELLDGDGLSVPALWLEDVMKALEKCFKDTFGIKKSPKIFVLTVLGTQSTGKSTLLNTMFGVQFPVSAGRCTKGAFMQLIPIFIGNFPCEGLLVIDTEGLGAPEYKQDNTHDNEIATFVLGISDLAIINVRGEVPTNIENFLQVSTCALMRMSMVDFHPSVVFVHQNCDPSSKEKNLTGRHSFMKVMDEVVSTQAKLIQKQDRFGCFQDVVDISLKDEKNDFVYFPQLLEGAPPMSPPSGNYSEACSDLTSYVLNKMQENFESFNNAQTLQEFAEKIKLVWNGVLEENFVLSLINSAEIQVKYDIDNQMSNWKVKMESYMEGVLEKFCKEVEADFKAKEPNTNLLRIKQEQIEMESHDINNEEKKSFIAHIEQQTLNQAIFKNWEQKCINKMDEVRKAVMENCKRRLNDYYKHEKNDAKWKDELQKSKNELHDKVKLIANELLQKKESGSSPEFTDEEIEDEFEKFWISKKNKFILNKEKTFAPDNVTEKFVNEIGIKYGNAANFKNIHKNFGLHLENGFKIEWIKLTHVEFHGNYLFRKYKEHIATGYIDFWRNMEDLIANVEHRLKREVIYLQNNGGLIKMQFQPDSTIFDCGTLVRQYLDKATDILIQTHNQSTQKAVYNLTATFNVMFLFFAAQIAIPYFEKAQQSFIDYMDISTKLDSEKENTKQLFTLILKKAGTFTIAANQITKILHDAIKDTSVKQIRILCKDILLRLVTQKVHVHGLVLHDVIAMLEDDVTEESICYIKEYFQKPFLVFKKKILHVLDGCPDINLNEMLRVKFDTAVRKIRYLLEGEIQASKEIPIVEVICKCQYVRSLGIGEGDFDGIEMPKFSKHEASKLATNSVAFTMEDEEINKKEVKKRMADENEIINKMKTLITETDQEHIDINLLHQAEIKADVISDVNHHLFHCLKTCPLCHSPCNETHPTGVGPDSNHSSRCHRPQGFAGYVNNDSGKFAITCCNDNFKCGTKFRNGETGYEWVNYRDYRKVNSYYGSWNIVGLASEDGLYWKYITYQVTRNLNRFFPYAKIPDVIQWSGISKSEAIRIVNSLFHLDGNTIARNEHGFHYIKASEDYT